MKADFNKTVSLDRVAAAMLANGNARLARLHKANTATGSRLARLFKSIRKLIR